MCVCTPVCYSSQDERVRIRFHCSLFKVVQHGPDEPTGAFRVHKMNSHRMCKHLDLALLLFLPRPLPTAARQRIRRTGVELELLDVDDPVPGWSTRFRRAARRLYHLSSILPLPGPQSRSLRGLTAVRKAIVGLMSRSRPGVEDAIAPFGRTCIQVHQCCLGSKPLHTSLTSAHTPNVPPVTR